MPTLIDVPLDASAEGTVNDQSRREFESFQDGETVLNDSTRLVDESIIGDELALRSTRAVDDTLEIDETRLSGESSTFDNDETRLGDETTFNDETVLGCGDSQLENQTAPHDEVEIPNWEKQEATVRITGPKEEQYIRQHERYVSRVIADVQHRHPDKLKDFRSMSQIEKEDEKRRVAALLGRLGISTDTVLRLRAQTDSNGRVALAETSSDSSATRLDQDQSSLTTDSPQRRSIDDLQDENASAAFLSKGEDDDDMVESDQSKALFSPEHQIDELAARLDQSMALLSPTSNISSVSRDLKDPLADDSPTSSVELVRKSKSVVASPPLEMYESPTITTSRSKRCASASGKRGTDLSRMRIDDDSFISFDASIARASEMISSPSQLQCSSVKSPESPLFSASQSPICDHNSSWDEASVESHPKDHDTDDDRSVDDTLLSPDCTINHKRRVRWNENSFLHEIPTNVRLKDGVPFRMKPLRVGQPSRRGGGKSGRRRRVSLVSMPDPLSGYQGTLRSKMKAAYAWMRDRDSSDDAMGGVLFSMGTRQIIDATLKLIVKVPSQHTSKDMINDVVNGGTLIVARSKEDLDEWQSALREGTAYSVLNHATMTVEERKRTSTASRCAGYDIVVTTFDAIKSKDIATPLDCEGHVVLDKIGYQDGWYSSRSSGSEAPDRCEQLSVLHQINWRRVIFVDAFGRKSYLAKLGTSRAVAAVALSGCSR